MSCAPNDAELLINPVIIIFQIPSLFNFTMFYRHSETQFDSEPILWYDATSFDSYGSIQAVIQVKRAVDKKRRTRNIFRSYIFIILAIGASSKLCNIFLTIWVGLYFILNFYMITPQSPSHLTGNSYHNRHSKNSHSPIFFVHTTTGKFVTGGNGENLNHNLP